jgi:hypothetical protein
VSDVEKDLSQIWPTLHKILKLTKDIDTFLIDFSMEEARNGAWQFALLLAPLDKTEFDKQVEKRDLSIANFAKYVYNLDWLPSMVFKWIRLFEKGTVEQKIAKLQD